MVKASGCTHVGRRENNEDSFVIGKNFAVVADGMGGHNKGEVASEMAVKCICEKLEQLNSVSKKDILDAVNYANTKIFKKSCENNLMQDMGTTVVVCAWNQNNVLVANVGDSRCYLISRDNFKQITTDHSYVQSLIDSGEITEIEAEERLDKNVILRAAGCESTVDADLFNFSVSSGDMVLLCSDGLSGVVQANEMKSIFDKYKSADCIAKALIDKAYENGGSDNITAVVIIFE